MFPLAQRKSFPLPTDKFLKPIQLRYKRLQDEVLQNWKEDFVHHRIQFRGFIDLNQTRLVMRNDPRNPFKTTPVISLIPFIGPDVEDSLLFYHEFFSVYDFHCRAILVSMISELMWKDELIEDAPADNFIVRKVGLAIVQLLIRAMNAQKLTPAQLSVFKTFNMKKVDIVREMIEDWDFTRYMDDGFVDGDPFYKTFDDAHMQGFWNHARKMHEGIIPQKWSED